MNKNIIKINFLAFGLIAVLFLSGCDDAKYKPLDNKVFLAETGTSSNMYKKVTIDEAGATVSATARLTNPADADMKIKFVVDAEALTAFNKRNSAAYAELPVSNYKLDQTEVVIKKGESLAPAVNIALKALTPEMVETGNQYALAVKALPVDAPDVALEGANTMVYVLDQVITTAVPVFGTDPVNGYHSATAPVTGSLVLNQWTVEMRINMNGFGRNNQALFGVWGPDSEIYMRFGDANTPFNTLQVKFAGSQFDRSIKEFSPNTWYHIAVTYDGSMLKLYIDGAEDVKTDKWAGKTTTITNKIFVSSSGSAWFINSCMMSEVRLWNVCRTQKEIINNPYSINPKTNGLLMYWKMNEGSGNVLRNSVAGAPDLTAEGNKELRWLDNVRSDGKGRTSL